MKRAALILLSVLALASLNGCKQIEFKDGKVPDAFLSQAKALVGTYEGHVQANDGSGISQNLRALKLNVSIDADQRLHLVSSGDWIDERCHSSIGQILNVHAISMQVVRVAFAFDAGTCKNDATDTILMFQISSNKQNKTVLDGWTRIAYTQSLNKAGTEVTQAPVLQRGHFEQQ